MPRRSALLFAGLGLVAATTLWLSRPQVLHEEVSESGRIRVVERRDGVRELYLGDSPNRQTALHPDRPGDPVLPYTRVAMAALAMVAPDARVLFVGLGGGAMPRYVRWRFPAMRTEAVELEYRIVVAARSWFGFPPDSVIPVHVGDGRAFIESAPAESWDLVVLDAFSGGEVPRALTTMEFLQAVRRTLAPGGVVVSNLHTSSPEYDQMVATYGGVFPFVALLSVPRRRQVVLLASQGTDLSRDVVLERVRQMAVGRDLGFDLQTLVARGYRVPPAGAAPVLRDVTPDRQ